MTMNRANGLANILILASLMAAIIIGCIAIVQQPWRWWEIGLALCGVGAAAGFVASAMITNHPDYRAER